MDTRTQKMSSPKPFKSCQPSLLRCVVNCQMRHRLLSPRLRDDGNTFFKPLSTLQNVWIICSWHHSRSLKWMLNTLTQHRRSNNLERILTGTTSTAHCAAVILAALLRNGEWVAEVQTNRQMDVAANRIPKQLLKLQTNHGFSTRQKNNTIPYLEPFPSGHLWNKSHVSVVFWLSFFDLIPKRFLGVC